MVSQYSANISYGHGLPTDWCEAIIRTILN